MRVGIAGLDDFGLTPGAFFRVPGLKVVAHLSLGTFDVTPDVVRRPAKERHPYLRARVTQWLAELRRRFPEARFALNQPDPSDGIRRRWSALPTSVVVRTTAHDLQAMTRAPGIGHVYVAAIQGRRRRQRQRASSTTWHCVHACIAITIEGQTRGMQTVEDRFVVVRASSAQDAIRRLEPEWRSYAAPYLNSSGQVVRWQLDTIVDVYRTDEDHIDPAGTEVYSRLRRRRLPPADRST